ncbi:MAG: winged helix-turn-helix domain-containing protein [Sedimentitalea sp.]|uniref:winged helix-turn-helix domain-containing tetratricopeptide repeat protein n=1 Tax=Sedimentitalea sp. TaxID=2048915 RepID=UPI00326559B7
MTQTPVNNGAEHIRLGGTCYIWQDGQLLDAEGRTVPLRAKSLRMLEVLLSERGRIVSKDRLSELVWPDVIATDESIARCIADIRKVLGDRAHKAVETFPKQGYRLNVDTRRQSSLTPTSRTGLLILAVSCAVILLGINLWFSDTRVGAPDTQIAFPAADLQKSVAILPFTADAEQDRLLAGGLSDDLEIRLAEISGIRIVSQVQTQAMAARLDSLIELSQVLTARYLIGGSVRSNGGDVAVSLQLINGSDGATIWADRFEGPRENLLGYRQKLPEALVKAMHVTLEPRDLQRLAREGTTVPAAFEDVMHARRELSLFTYQGSLAAEKYLRRALERDPNYARAYAELAAAFAIRFENSWVLLSGADTEKALYFAQKALELDAELWLAHYALGRLHSVIPSGDIDVALNHLRTAMSLQPANDDARIYYATLTTMAGRPEAALPLFESVMATHPVPPFWYYIGYSNTLLHLRRYDEAEEAALTCVNQMPNSPYCLRALIALYGRLGRQDDADWTMVEYAALGYELTIAAMMKSALERDPSMYAFLEESYRLAGLE